MKSNLSCFCTDFWPCKIHNIAEKSCGVKRYVHLHVLNSGLVIIFCCHVFVFNNLSLFFLNYCCTVNGGLFCITTLKGIPGDSWSLFFMTATRGFPSWLPTQEIITISLRRSINLDIQFSRSSLNSKTILRWRTGVTSRIVPMDLYWPIFKSRLILKLEFSQAQVHTLWAMP